MADASASTMRSPAFAYVAGLRQMLPRRWAHVQREKIRRRRPFHQLHTARVRILQSRTTIYSEKPLDVKHQLRLRAAAGR